MISMAASSERITASYSGVYGRSVLLSEDTVVIIDGRETLRLFSGGFLIRWPGTPRPATLLAAIAIFDQSA
jgi:hypothetical protein